MPFLQKVCAVHAYTRCSLFDLFFISAHFTALMREQERLVADVKCTLLGLGDERWSLESPLVDSHIAWAFLMLWANAFLGYCIQRIDITFSTAHTVPFQKGTGPAFKIDNIKYLLPRED